MFAHELQYRRPIYIFHRDIRHRYALGGVSGDLRDAGVVYLGDSRVVQPAEQLRFTLESANHGRRGHVAPNDLQGNGSSGPILLGEKDDSHRAAAKLFDQGEVSDALADSRRPPFFEHRARVCGMQFGWIEEADF